MRVNLVATKMIVLMGIYLVAFMLKGNYNAEIRQNMMMMMFNDRNITKNKLKCS